MENKFYIYALGCKVNTYEIEAVKEDFLKQGLCQTQHVEEASYILINTCCVTNTAQAKSRQKIHSLHKQNPQAKILVMGCYVQGFAEEIEKMDFVCLFVGTKGRNKIQEYIKKEMQHINLVSPLKKEDLYENLSLTSYSENTRAFLKIQDGCNNFCSYCIIPYVRGNIKSRPLEEILKEAQSFLEKGYKEIVLTGIHTGSYGKDTNSITFSDLVEKLLQLDNLYRLRISSIEESEIDDKLIRLLKENKKLAHHFHIPLQAGSNHILRLMNRKYDQETFIRKVHFIQQQVPDIAITTDIIVGFPQETEEDFLETLKVAQEIPFAKIHVFPYSPRNFTAAAKMSGQIDGNIKKNRTKQLNELSSTLSLAYQQKFLNQEMDILIEENEQNYVGHTSNFIKVICEKKSSNFQKNDIIRVKVVKVFSDYVIAERIDKNEIK